MICSTLVFTNQSRAWLPILKDQKHLKTKARKHPSTPTAKHPRTPKNKNNKARKREKKGGKEAKEAKLQGCCFDPPQLQRETEARVWPTACGRWPWPRTSEVRRGISCSGPWRGPWSFRPASSSTRRSLRDGGGGGGRFGRPT